jgi:hypothetical protein
MEILTVVELLQKQKDFKFSNDAIASDERNAAQQTPQIIFFLNSECVRREEERNSL